MTEYIHDEWCAGTLGLAGSECNCYVAVIRRLEARIKVLEKERDEAIAHDRQPYPTAAAYETVCAARTKWQTRIEAPEKDRPSAAEEDAAVAMITALPDVLGAEILREYGVTIVATIKGEVYDEAQMGRLLDAECAFLEARPSCYLSFRYVPAALAAEEIP